MPQLRFSTQQHPQLTNCDIIYANGDFYGHVYKTNSGYYTMLTNRQRSDFYASKRDAVKALYNFKTKTEKKFQQSCERELAGITSNWGHTQTPGMSRQQVQTTKSGKPVYLEQVRGSHEEYTTRSDGKKIRVDRGRPAPKKTASTISPRKRPTMIGGVSID